MKGRPRSESARRAVLDAALCLAQESGGGKGVTMEAVAKRAGVGKQTVYKWWGSPGDIFLEILRETARQEIDETGSEDLEAFLVHTFDALTPVTRLILKSFVAEALGNESLRTKFVDEFIISRRTALQKVLSQTKGLLIHDQTVVTDFIFGLLWYRLILGVGPLDGAEGGKIAGLLLGKE